MQELPVLPQDPRCPAAFPIRGASLSQQGVVCRLMKDAVESDPGERMTAGALGRVRDTIGGVYLNLKSDPGTVTGFCHGDAVPVVTDEEGQGRASYTYCPVYQAEVKRREEGRRELVVEEQPESVAMGVPGEAVLASHEAADPWAAARAGLDELAPPARVG